MTDLVQQIASKSAELPVELQNEVLDFVDFVTTKGRRSRGRGTKFASVRGILKTDLSNLESDVAAVRREMWGGFPREDSE